MSGMAHFVWFVLTLLTGLLALPFWILAALMCGSGRKKREEAMKREELQLLREIAGRSKK